MNEPNERAAESRALYEGLLEDTRPLVNLMIKQYAVFLAELGSDEKAFHAIVKWIDNLHTTHAANEKTYMALAAFMARRLCYHKPRLRVSMN